MSALMDCFSQRKYWFENMENIEFIINSEEE